ncbi:glycosyltransferase family 2 protein [Acidimangrovimonas sediminis]|uniref:glycosyltransferase family 2 protein n=1 Tax=Acidimangrovimonas sediminis TaxID=2056283 RepID=UPI000C8061E3|nr:glycosyltransferase [Acidimangrovimonas sediminis]
MATQLHPEDPHRDLFLSYLRSQPQKVAEMRLVLAIATAGRPAIVAETLRDIARQSRRPDFVILSVSGPEDLDEACLDQLPFPCMVVTGHKGASVQRNRAIATLGRDDIVLFLDDDFLMAPDYVEQTLALFDANPDIMVATGRVIADGILGPGMQFQEGRDRIRAVPRRAASADLRMEETYNGYGCNMAVRAQPLIEHEIRFDESLPLYAWLEDVDLSRRLSAHGRIVRSGAMRGVHLGTKTGRTPGVKLGYSQMANPVYLMRKGTMAPKRALAQMGRNLASNVVKSVRPEPWVDRRGRLRGNLMALIDVALRRDTPERILRM